MAIVPVRSLPLFAFANDGSIAWLRAAGSKVMAVDAKSGEVLREVTLDPAPFGITWNIERVGKFFVVKDDREIAAYDAEAGTRLWKRTGPTRVAFVGQKGERHVTIAPGPAGVEIFEMDLSTGDVSKSLTVEGSMRYIGAHGTIAGDTLVFATDERDVYAVDTKNWAVIARHSFDGSHALPPVATDSGVHVAVIAQTMTGPVTTVVSLDPTDGTQTSSYVLPGAAHAMTRGNTGVVLDVKRTATGMLERVAFRPHAPHIRLAIAKNVDVVVAPPRTAPAPPRLPSRPPSRPPPVEIVAAPRPKRGQSEIPPGPPTDEDARPQSTRDGFVTLLELMRVKSDALTRIAEAFGERPADVVRMHDVGLRFRDPRVRWSAKPGRDPCLVDLAIHDSGDTIATYWYPPNKATQLPVVRVDTAGEARWLADDFDAWLAGYLLDAKKKRADLVANVLEVLGYDTFFLRESRATLPPPWFFEAHGTRWTMFDVEEALRGGDGVGAERMLVALGRNGYAAQAKDQLADIYETFEWGHHRAVVVETW